MEKTKTILVIIHIVDNHEDNPQIRLTFQVHTYIWMTGIVQLGEFYPHSSKDIHNSGPFIHIFL